MKFKPLFVNIEITVTALPPFSTTGSPDRKCRKAAPTANHQLAKTEYLGDFTGRFYWRFYWEF
jgi:hypothetical protein